MWKIPTKKKRRETERDYASSICLFTPQIATVAKTQQSFLISHLGAPAGSQIESGATGTQISPHTLASQVVVQPTQYWEINLKFLKIVVLKNVTHWNAEISSCMFWEISDTDISDLKKIQTTNGTYITEVKMCKSDFWS